MDMLFSNLLGGSSRVCRSIKRRPTQNPMFSNFLLVAGDGLREDEVDVGVAVLVVEMRMVSLEVSASVVCRVVSVVDVVEVEVAVADSSSLCSSSVNMCTDANKK